MRFKIVFILFVMIFSAGAACAQTPDRRTIWTGVYTATQAARGEEVYKANCARCHGEDLSRNPQAVLNGNDFLQRWREDNVESLFTFVRTSMPPGRRGTPRVALEDKQYLDVLTYIFKANDFPAGERELTAADVAEIHIEEKDGPKPLPNSSLVLVVGCMTKINEDTWSLTRATEPVRTRIADVATMDELQADQSKPAGDLTFRLQNILYLGTTFKPQAYEGRRMQAKGILVRQPSAERIDIRSLAEVSATCGSSRAF
jgi:mono/diheme cytochrome c family protein